MNALSRLQDLLRELFQFDLADLDYRLLRLKHAEIEAFLTKQLPASVEQAFQSIGSAERASVDDDLLMTAPNNANLKTT